MSLFKVVEVSKPTLQNVVTYSTASGNAVLTKLTYFILETIKLSQPFIIKSRCRFLMAGN